MMLLKFALQILTQDSWENLSILIVRIYFFYNVKEAKISFILVNASEAGAGNLEIIVSVNGVNVPNYVQSEGNAKFRVNFKPRDAAPHSLSVRFNGEPIPGNIICL